MATSLNFGFIAPVSAPVVEGWGQDRSYRGGWHQGLDFACPIGTPVKAVGDGVVSTSVDLTGSDPAGQMLTIDHPGGIRSRYLHLSERHVAKGTQVRRGQVVALSGASGIQRSAAHLHFDLKALPATIAAYVLRFGMPSPAIPAAGSGGWTAIPAEPFIPANYDKNTKNEAASRHVPVGALVGVGAATLGVLVLIGTIGYLALSRRWS